MGRKWDGNGKKMNDTVKFDNCSAIIRQNEFFSLETTGWVTANHQNQNNSVRFSNRSEMGADMLLWSIHLHIFLKAIKPVNMICFFFSFWKSYDKSYMKLLIGNWRDVAVKREAGRWRSRHADNQNATTLPELWMNGSSDMDGHSNEYLLWSSSSDSDEFVNDAGDGNDGT